MGGPFTVLAELLAQGGDIGFGAILTRRVAGSQRTSFEAFGPRLRELAEHVLILSGQPDEGPLAGGVAARQWPPGRGILISGRARPQLVQCCLETAGQPDPPASGTPASGTPASGTPASGTPASGGLPGAGWGSR
jgi:hypothetical protein